MKHFLLLIILFNCSQIFGQIDTIAEQRPTIQPTVMVIPFAKEHQSMRNVLENDIYLRVAMTKVKEGFDNRGYSTIDFRGRLKQLSNEDAMELGNAESVKQKVIELSGADIYVETEAKVIKTSKGNSVTVIVTAYDAFSGQSLANKVGSSPKFYTENYDKLTQKAVDDLIDDFLNTLQEKFTDMLENGRTVTINIGFSEDSEMDMDSEFTDDEEFLSDLLEYWFEDNAYKGYFHIQGVTATKMMLDDVRIPVKDPKSGRNYRTTRFAALITKYLKTLDLDVVRDVQGNKIFITIQ